MESKKKFYLEAPVKVHTYDTDYMGIVGQRIFPVGITIFKNKVLSLPYEIRSATSRHPSGCANRQL